MMREWRGVLHTLVGFESNSKNGAGDIFNFILSNGTRSTQRDKGEPTKYTHMIPSDALNKIISFLIYWDHDEFCVTGFAFFDKDGDRLWNFGWTNHD